MLSSDKENGVVVPLSQVAALQGRQLGRHAPVGSVGGPIRGRRKPAIAAGWHSGGNGGLGRSHQRYQGLPLTTPQQERGEGCCTSARSVDTPAGNSADRTRCGALTRLWLPSKDREETPGIAGDPGCLSEKARILIALAAPPSPTSTALPNTYIHTPSLLVSGPESLLVQLIQL